MAISERERNDRQQLEILAISIHRLHTRQTLALGVDLPRKLEWEGLVVLIKLVGGGSAALAKRISLKGRTFAVGRDLAVDRVWLKF